MKKNKPYAQKPYEPKLRLLITNHCTQGCYFCHNEGQKKDRKELINIKKFKNYLSELRERFDAITISGGEPLEHPDLGTLIKMLDEYSFEVSLDTFGHLLTTNNPYLKLLSNIHVSFINFKKKSPLLKYDKYFSHKLRVLCNIKNNNPILNFCINIPFISPKIQSLMLDRAINMAKELDAKIKFIHYFQPFSNWNGTSEDWFSRWNAILEQLYTRKFKISEVNPRETEFINEDGQLIELSDVPCIGTDNSFSGGKCFLNMDVTIQPDLSVKMCRWQNNHIPLESLCNSIDNTIGQSLASLINKDTILCPYKINTHPLIEHKLENFVIDKQYQWPKYRKSITDGLNKNLKVTEPSYFGRAGTVRRFENLFATMLNCKYALSSCSGSAALFLAFLSMGIKPGDEVILPILTYPGMITPLLLLGANLIFCDVNSETGNISVKSFMESVNRNTHSVVVTHFWGNPAPMNEIVHICHKYDIKIIEDASHAFGAKYNGKYVGTIGDVGCFSLQANKHICAGEGGMIITNNEEIYNLSTCYSSLNKRILDSVNDTKLRKFWETGLGLKLKIHPFAAAMGLVFLEYFKEIKNYQDEKIGLLEDAVNKSPFLEISPVLSEANRTFYTFKPLVSKEIIYLRDFIIDTLINKGLKAKIPDLRPLHMSCLFKNNFDQFRKFYQQNDISVTIKKSYPGSEQYFRRVISLPSFVSEPIELVIFYCNTLTNILNNRFITQTSKLCN